MKMIRNPFLMISRIGKNGAVCQGEKICGIGRALFTNRALITSPQYLSDCGCDRPNCRVVSVEDSPDSFAFARIACGLLATRRNGEATTSKRSWAKEGLDSAQFRSGHPATCSRRQPYTVRSLAQSHDTVRRAHPLKRPEPPSHLIYLRRQPPF